MNAARKIRDSLEQVPQELRPLVGGYLKRREDDVATLLRLLKDHNFSGIKSMGHKLKGTGLGYGFPSITAIGTELEKAAATHDWQRTNGLIEELGELVTDLQATLPKQESSTSR